MTLLAPGFVRADKPAGVTSHDVVAAHRRELGLKAGHAGTLDPFATGLLLVLLGPATRLQRYVLGLPKTYVATARLGWRSSTGDPDGELSETGCVPEDLTLPEGLISQRVPMTSAVKVGGERLYRKARRGEEVERPVREVNIHRAELLAVDGDCATYEIVCSSGTYVRTLLETLGDAYCASLRRTAIGPLSLSPGSVPPPGDREGLAAAARAATIEPAATLLGHLPAFELTPDQARLLRNGVPVTVTGDEPGGPDRPLRLIDGGELVGVGVVTDGLLTTEVVLPSD